MENNEKIQFLAIGDIVTEPFIKIKDAAVHCKLDQTACELCFRFGDKVPYESATLVRAVGNSANAAVSASRLGVKASMMTYVGNDDIGKGNIEELKRNNVDTSLVSVVDGYASNFHYVLWYDVERTILVNHTEFPYSFPMDLPAPEWVYLSSLASNSAKYHDEIAEYLSKNPSVKLAFQPGTFQMKLGIDTLKTIYEHTEIFFCNVEEAQRILKVDTREVKELMQGLKALGPKKVVMTDGIAGAYAYDGDKFYFMPVYPHEPVERTGAGDAFASTITAALVLGHTFEEALTWAPINSMSVTQKVGAQAGLLTKSELEQYLKDAPSDYKLKEI